MGFFDKLWEGVKGVAQVAAFIPGPIGTAGKIISTIGAATSKTKNPADAANAQIQAGADAQMAYQEKAMKQYQDLMNRQLAVGTADKQMAYDVNRGVYQSNQANMLPYQTASLSALQALPQLQQLLGMQAYNVGNQISSYTPPAVNYADLYKNSQNTMFPDAEDATITQEPASGLRVNQVVGGTAADQQAAANTGSSQSNALTPYSGPAYDLTNSPLFQYQKQIADEGLTNQLASQGLSGGTYAQRELSRQNMALTANERERVVGNLQSMYNTGMGGAQLGQATFQTPQSSITGTLGQGAQDIASMYGNMGAIQGQLGSQLANSSIAGANYQANQPSGMQTAMEMASQYGWLNPGKKTTPTGSNDATGGWGSYVAPFLNYFA